jgi:hypothetical protein
MDESKPVPPQNTPNDTPKDAPGDAPKDTVKDPSEEALNQALKNLNAALTRETPTTTQTAPGHGPDPQTLANFERAAIEMAGRVPASPPPEPKPPQVSKPPAAMSPDIKVTAAQRIDPPKTPGPKAPRPKAGFKLVEQFDLTEVPFSAAPMATPPPTAPALRPSSIRPMFDDTFRLTFSTGQSIVVAIAIALIMLGAFGMATYSSIVAHDWGCRVGLVEKYCPVVPEPKPLPRPEIPT